MPPYIVSKWDRRNFALHDGEDLVAVTVYKKGANHVKAELEKRDAEITKHKKATDEHQAS